MNFLSTVVVVFSSPLILSLSSSLSTLSPSQSNLVMNHNSQNKILCVGVCSLDTIATLDEFPSPDSKVRSTSLKHAGGGNAANTAVAISRLSIHTPTLKSHNMDLHVDLLSAIGNDSNGDSIISGLIDENVGIEYIERFDGDSPWSYILIVGDTRTIIHQPARRELSIDYVKRNLIQNEQKLNIYQAVHFDARHADAANYVAKECVKLGIPYSVDVERPRDGLLDLLSNASVVICNSNYVDLVLNRGIDKSYDHVMKDELVKRFQSVLKEQAPNAQIGIMTMGRNGSFLISQGVDHCDKICQEHRILLEKRPNDDNGTPCVYEQNGALWCDVFSNCDVVDTTGAGDAYQGGFLSAIWSYTMYKNQQQKQSEKGSYLVETQRRIPSDKVILSHALRIASRVAAKKVAKAGARDGLPEMDGFIEREFNAMIHSKK